MFNLTRHTYAAEIAGGLIFLDLKRDSYTYLTPQDAAEILPLLRGTIRRDLEEIEQAPPQAGGEASIVDELKLAGLITDDETGRPFRPISYDSVMDEQPRLIGEDRPKVRPVHVWNFFRSVLLAKAMLSWLPLHWVVAFVKKRRIGRTRAVTAHSAAQLTEIYRRLRPLLFSRTDRCLLDSLSLINFLRRYRVRASWRFGVRLQPFKAHAWVQDDQIVFDDMAANIHSFTVILEA
jgi:hypothetical protein